jgi:H-type lectin domain-containing protein
MRKIRSSLVGVDQGAVMLFSDFQDGGEMWTGSGPRECRRLVTFSEPYLTPPVVQAHIGMWDMDAKSNGRADITAEEVSTTGFTIVFRTWSDTRVARVRADWIAVGEISGEDDWDIS